MTFRYDDTNESVPVHIMCYEPFLKILKSICTIRDLINYLDDKEDFLNICKQKGRIWDHKNVKRPAMMGAEEDLFALWKPESFI